MVKNTIYLYCEIWYTDYVLERKRDYQRETFQKVTFFFFFLIWADGKTSATNKRVGIFGSSRGSQNGSIRPRSSGNWGGFWKFKVPGWFVPAMYRGDSKWPSDGRESLQYFASENKLLPLRFKNYRTSVAQVICSSQCLSLVFVVLGCWVELMNTYLFWEQMFGVYLRVSVMSL